MISLRDELFSTSPYEAFDPAEYELDLYGWGSEHPVFRKMIEAASPRLIVEVGTWKGASAIHMARCLKELGLHAQILCVDTWLGALEFWGDKEDPLRYRALRLKHGYPTVYYQFLANVVKTGFQDTIVPFPETSEIAVRWLRKRGVSPELIYIDGSHEEEDVFRDLCGYWQILAPGGVLFGDDYDEYWPSVRSAVRRFSQVIGLSTDEEDGKWAFHKPADWRETALRGDKTRAMHLANTTRFEVVSEQLTTLLHLVQANQGEVQAARDALQLKDRELQARIGDLQARDQQIQVKDQEIHAAHQTLQAQNKELRIKDQQLQAKDQQLQAKDRQLQAGNQELQAKDQQLQTRDQQLLARDQQLQARDQQLQSRGRGLEARNEEFRLLQSELAATQSRLHRWESWFDGVRGSHTWQWFARYTVGRRPLPIDPDSAQP
jgi:hypothetical protein